MLRLCKNPFHPIGRAVLLCAALLLCVGLAVPCSANQRKRKSAIRLPVSATLCRVNDLTVQVPQDFLALRVTGNSFAARENSAGLLTFRNGFTQPIKDIAAIWEYTDEDGRSVAAMAAEAESLGPDQSWLVARFGQRRLSVMPLPAPISSGANVMLGGTSAITTSVCPAQIRVTLLHAMFADGKTLDWSARAWRLDPVLYSAGTVEAAHSIFAPLAAIPPAQLRLRLQIAPDGGVSGIHGTAQASEPVAATLKTILSALVFSPALENGHPAESELDVLLRLNPMENGGGSGIHILAREDVPTPLVVMDLLQGSAGEWRLFFAGAPFPFATATK